MIISVYEFLKLFASDFPVKFYINGYDYYFPTIFMIPDEIMEAPIQGVDNPEFYNYCPIITINLSSQDFDDFEIFKEKIKDFCINE